MRDGLSVKKYRCSHTKGDGHYTFYVDVIADSEGHARELAYACTKEKSTFPRSVDPGDWNVAEVDSGFDGPARVDEYYKK